MTRDERIAAIDAIIDRARSSAGAIGAPCASCRHSREIDYSWGSCRSPVAKLEGLRISPQGTHNYDWPRISKMRSETGLCGPEAILHERRHWHHLMFWTQPTMARQFFGGIVAAVAGVAAFVLIITWAARS